MIIVFELKTTGTRCYHKANDLDEALRIINLVEKIPGYSYKNLKSDYLHKEEEIDGLENDLDLFLHEESWND